MKYSLTIEINAPREKVADMLADQGQKKKWLKELMNIKHVKGAPKEVGAVAMLQLNVPGMEQIKETIELVDFPNRFVTVYEMKQATFIADSNLEAISAGLTRYTLHHEFDFKGMLKLATALMKPAFIRHSEKILAQIKNVAEE